MCKHVFLYNSLNKMLAVLVGDSIVKKMRVLINLGECVHLYIIFTILQE